MLIRSSLPPMSVFLAKDSVLFSSFVLFLPKCISCPVHHHHLFQLLHAIINNSNRALSWSSPEQWSQLKWPD